jgi:hypothetical protein
MNDETLRHFADRVRTVATAFPYPAPSLASRRTSLPPTRPRLPFPRALTWAAILFILFGVTMIAVPQARAGVVRLLRIGAISLHFDIPTPIDNAPAMTSTSPSGEVLAPLPGPDGALPGISILDGLEGETTLEDARGRAGFDILVPSHPADLGPPDRVFVQEQGGFTVLLVWLSPDGASVRLLLQELSAGSWGLKKVELTQVQAAEVDGQPAIWAIGPYVLLYANGAVVEQRTVGGHALIWEHGDVTLRLESDLELGEALRIADSLE